MDKNLVDRIRELIADIERRVPYASVTNFEGESLEIRIDRKDEKLSNPKANRGLVLTVFNGEHFQEFATDDDDPDLWSRFFRAAADSVSVRPSKYEIPVGAGGEAAYRTEVAIDPDRKSTVEKLDLMRTRRDRILKSSQVVNAMVTYTERRENKIFINRARTVEEQIRRITNFLIAFVTDGKTMKTNFIVCGGTGGLERIDVRDERIDAMVETARKLLGAQRIEPGFYDVVAAPSITGLIAHEAFGHGVEIDMYLKGRARSQKFLGTPIASTIVNIIDDPSVPAAYGSYYIDDEGEPARPTYIIKDGRFVQGLSDLYSSLATGLPKTANGRRESFERKIYSRMSNTFIQPRELVPAEIIASVDNGVYLEQGLSGMEDPKGWGLQIIVHYGREIRHGRLTDRIYSPLGVTGYVPEVLQNISMIGSDFELDGGTCGKGYKEYVPVSSGGPHIRTRVRLG